MAGDEPIRVDPSRRAFVAGLIATGLSAPKVVTFLLGSPVRATALAPMFSIDPGSDLSGNYLPQNGTFTGGSGNYLPPDGTFSFPSGNYQYPSGNFGDPSGNYLFPSGNIPIGGSGNLIDQSGNWWGGSSGNNCPIISGTFSTVGGSANYCGASGNTFPPLTPGGTTTTTVVPVPATTSTTIPRSTTTVPQKKNPAPTVTLPSSAGKEVPVKKEPAKAFAVDAAVAVNGTKITVGLLAPASSPTVKDPLVKYTVTLTATTKGAKTLVQTVNVKAGKVSSLTFTGARKSAYQLKVTATQKSGKTQVWNGPSVTTK